MENSITPEQVRENNRNRIYEYIYRKGENGSSQQEISIALNISRPTVSENLRELEKYGLVLKSGLIENSNYGRKPVLWTANADYKIAIGVEIRESVVKIIAINLYGSKIKREVVNIEFKNDDSYFKFISEKIKNFISSLNLTDASEKILGIGFTHQGLVSENGDTVIYGEILKCTGLKIDVFKKWLDYPCRFVHEPDGAALSELWVSPELEEAMYLSMSIHLGGALILDRKIINGQHRHGATFEHITAQPDGKLCYCGKRGCFETTCSMEALIGGDKEPDEFFNLVRANEPEALNKWNTFLKYLARLITSLHLVIDTKYILGGHLAPYFNEDDIKMLYDEIRKNTPFKEDDDYIIVSKMPSHNITIGAALPYILEFLESAGVKALEISVASD